MAGKKEILKVVGKGTQFTSDNQPENRGRKPGVLNAATRLERFLNLVRSAENPLTSKDEDLTVAEQMDLKQIAKALEGDTAAWEKINDRLEGKARQSTELTGADGTPLQMGNTTILKIQYRKPEDTKTEP
jgi:hypothetical protein